MTPQELSLAVKAAGCSLVAKEGRLFVTPPGRLPPALRPLLEAHKAELLAWLSAPPGLSDAWLDAVAAFWADHPDEPDCYVIRSRSGEILGCASSAELAEWDETRRAASVRPPAAGQVVGETTPVPTVRERRRKEVTR